MNPHPTQFQTAAGRRRRLESVALVVTLLMLSVITFLTVAFLVMTERNQADVGATVDLTTARTLGSAAAARAQGEIIARMMAHTNPYPIEALDYDYMVSRNYINTNGFNSAERTNDPNNVNYDYYTGGNTNFSAAKSGPAWAQNIANLWYDPRPPVFVLTNPAYPSNLDFRFWVDINRNGRFETNGYIPTIINERGEVGSNQVWAGEPEFIGVLRNPIYPHSATNPFVGRYAYLVLPIGKECDINYIHNFAKANYIDGAGVNNGTLTNGYNVNDGFARDQGVGSWELNLAGLLDAVSPWAYESNDTGYRNYAGTYLTLYSPYNYQIPTSGKANRGSAFDDAESILHYRDWVFGTPYMGTLYNTLPLYWTNIDYYCVGGSSNYPFDYPTYTNPAPPPPQSKYVNDSWPGSYSSNMFFDPQDLFDPNKTSMYFTNRMLVAGGRTNFTDRYTFERLLSCLGMGSSPEYGVWVYGDNDAPNNPTSLRTKVNINYNNTAQITNANAPYVAMPTNLVAWTPAGFFTNAAELLLRSQTFMFTNYVGTNANLVQGAFILHFGVTNIPIYRTNYPGIRYNAAVHRMLQLAANIYDATNPTNYVGTLPGLPPVRHPAVFRPVFQVVYAGTSNVGVNISGYVQVTNDAYAQMLKPFLDLNVTNLLNNANNPPSFTNGNVAGIPWIVAADKGLPAFYHYTDVSQVLFERKLLFPRKIVNNIVQSNLPPATTNQFYCMAMSNSIGMDAWNPYPTAFTGANGLYYYYSNYVTIQFTNGYNFGFTTNLAAYNYPYYGPINWRPGGGGANSRTGIVPIQNTNIVTLPPAYYSEALHRFYFVTNAVFTSNSFLARDMNQQGWPVYNWTVNVTNHVVYALFDGAPHKGGALLDFVNLGPFGSSINIQQFLYTNSASSVGGVLGASGSTSGNYWDPTYATSLPTSPMSQGVLSQIRVGASTNTPFENGLLGVSPSSSDAVLACPCVPTYVVLQQPNWVANDPLVHYTVDDLTWTSDPNAGPEAVDVNSGAVLPLTNSIGRVSYRYAPWGARDTIGNNMLFKDPLMYSSTNWAFPTNKFPGVGWVGRVHRGTPWQTVYLKADNPQSSQQPSQTWVSRWVNSPWFVGYEAVPETYPTNDWALVDLFTAVPNDNAARGLLSVNQANDAAWAAVFAGVMALSNGSGGVPVGVAINPSNDVHFLMEGLPGTNGINWFRTNQPNGVFHKIGDILAAPALTTFSPFLGTNAAMAADYSDEVVERIPQQVLSLLKVGEPQFAIFAWGQSLKPKGPPYLGGGVNQNIYTNYQITGEFLSRTICHVVHTNGLKMVIDSYNVEPGN
jgi:hypothetical protein